jgi:hypothetical protein
MTRDESPLPPPPAFSSVTSVDATLECSIYGSKFCNEDETTAAGCELILDTNGLAPLFPLRSLALSAVAMIGDVNDAAFASFFASGLPTLGGTKPRPILAGSRDVGVGDIEVSVLILTRLGSKKAGCSRGGRGIP